jgi:hypothetical protein
MSTYPILKMNELKTKKAFLERKAFNFLGISCDLSSKHWIVFSKG